MGFAPYHEMQSCALVKVANVDVTVPVHELLYHLSRASPMQRRPSKLHILLRQNMLVQVLYQYNVHFLTIVMTENFSKEQRRWGLKRDHSMNIEVFLNLKFDCRCKSEHLCNTGKPLKSELIGDEACSYFNLFGLSKNIY